MTKLGENVNFICRCGIRSPVPITCPRDGCPTPLTVQCAATPRKQ